MIDDRVDLGRARLLPAREIGGQERVCRDGCRLEKFHFLFWKQPGVSAGGIEYTAFAAPYESLAPTLQPLPLGSNRGGFLGINSLPVRQGS